MNDRIKVFFLEPTNTERRWLRRYPAFDKGRRCGDTEHYCNGMTLLHDCPKNQLWADYDKSNPQWPTKCDRCGVPFEAYDEYQQFSRNLFVRKDTGDTMTLQDAPAGACWDATWFVDQEYNKGKTGSAYNTGPDGRCLVVKLPDGHDWMIDSRCSNCTRRDDNEHFCWVRHGRPEDGTLHVDKNGNTCSAGAGSILTPKWHGFLHEGYLHT